MSHVHRFYIDPETTMSGSLSLPPEEAHHALHGVRLRVGDEAILFDGQGKSARALIDTVQKRSVIVSVQELFEHPKAEKRLTLLQAALHRPAAIEFILRHGAALGIDSFVFFRAEHSERALKLNPKWRRMTIESSKQCGRLWLPTCTVADSLAEALSQASGSLCISTQHEDAKPIAECCGEDDATVLIGPEGDFSSQELAYALAQGAVPIGLGPLTLRAEMAAITASALLRYHQGALGKRP